MQLTNMFGIICFCFNNDANIQKCVTFIHILLKLFLKMFISIANHNFRYCRNVRVTETTAACCVLGLLFDPVDGSSIFLRESP